MPEGIGRDRSAFGQSRFHRRHGCQSDIAETIVDLGGDYLLATKDNQKTAHAEINFISMPLLLM
ncbi:hypothetical protein [Mesorhizobium sp. M0895]|uniref:hypothetical protein n=1 Tax=Mesorhizobium sp. M0895 TaxID=2957019 RepID=UPI00333764AE